MTLHVPSHTADSSFLSFTAEELELQNAAASFLRGLVPLARLHGSDAADLAAQARREIGALGWFSLSLPEAFGGCGLSAVEHAVLFREVGRECGPIDILTQTLATLTLAKRGDLQSSLASGAEPVMLGVRDREGYRLLGAPRSRYVLCVERDGAALFDLAGAQITPRPSLDRATTMQVIWSLPAEPIVSKPGPSIWAMAQLGAAAMLVGVAERATSMIVEYAKVRETFGRKIGSYQAVRHPCADMELRAEAARSQLWYAAAALKGQRGDAEAHLDAAKHVANEAALTNADVSIQLHGGIGVTDEHDAHLLLKRSLLLGRTFGCKRTLLTRLLHARLED